MNSKIQSKPKKVWRRLAVIAGVVLALLPFFAAGAARLLVVHSSLGKADAIVILSGSATFRERAQHAAVLFNEGRAPRIVLTNDHLKSSWSQEEQRNPYYYERALDELHRAGVPNDRIAVIMVPIRSTYDEAVALKDYSEANHLNSMLVVTSAYHSRRAFWTFRRVFEGSGKLIGIDPAEPLIESPAAATWWLHRLGWEMVPKEYAKILVYWFRY
ncbi:MAG TPA: YdcF family protein [Pyrinomonadaceae bacterium]|nr:YdcF family protein [Pyrinomonadaceae bacterium]